MTPGDAQWWAISKGAQQLTPELIENGWHFCRDFDEDLVGPEAIETYGRGPRCKWCGFYPCPGYSATLDTWRRWLLIALLEKPGGTR